MKTSYAEAVWEGNLREGQGRMRSGSGSVAGSYTYASRFEEGQGTNPEELLGAAEAGCFSMAFSAELEKAGFRPERIETRAQVDMERVEGKNTIARIRLETRARVAGIDEQTFMQAAEAAKKGCPVSRALGGVEILLAARLEPGA